MGSPVPSPSLSRQPLFHATALFTKETEESGCPSTGDLAEMQTGIGGGAEGLHVPNSQALLQPRDHTWGTAAALGVCSALAGGAPSGENKRTKRGFAQ